MAVDEVGGSALRLLALVVGTFIIAQLLLQWLQRLRIQRIERKSLQLCSASASATKVPITIVTGFLGSGKTTLVNGLLSGDHGQRLMVIENELGAVSIDHELIDADAQKAAPAGVVVLKNGCMCCSGDTPGSELERVLDKLLDLSQGPGASLEFDRIVIETTGLADPAPIMQVLWRNEMRESRFTLDGVVTVVDAKHLQRHLQPHGPAGFLRSRPEAEKQIALADKIVVNKVDLVSAAQLGELTHSLTAVNRTAKQLRTTRAKLPWEELFGLALDQLSLEQRKAAALATPGATHGRSVSCVTLTADEDVGLEPLQRWLQALVRERHADLYRLKGILAVAGESRRFVVHGIHAEVQGSLADEWGQQPRRSVLVVIGHALDAERLQREFAGLHELAAQLCAEEPAHAE